MHNGGEGEGGSYRLPHPHHIWFSSYWNGWDSAKVRSLIGSRIRSQIGILGTLGITIFHIFEPPAVQKYRACWYIIKICSHVCPAVLCEFCQFPQGGAWQPNLPGAGPATIPEKAKSRRFWEILKQFGGNYDFFVGINEFGQICKKLWRALNQLLHTMPMFP